MKHVSPSQTMDDQAIFEMLLQTAVNAAALRVRVEITAFVPAFRALIGTRDDELDELV